MLSKTKKIALLTTGLVGALVTSSAVGVALSSCTSTTSTSTDENTKYNTYINWSDPNALTNLVVDESGLVYSDIHKTTIIAVTPSFTSTTVTIPASVTSITGYTEVLPSGATIVRGAFQPTATTTGTGSAVQSGVTLNNLVTTVKFAAGSNLKAIGSNAFNGCTLLQSIDLPSSVTMIGSNAFRGCALLSSIDLTNVEYIGDFAFFNVATNIANPSIKISLNKAVVIGNYAFQNAKISTVDLSANTSLISLGDYAFDGCSSLAGTIDLSKATSLLSTGANTFRNCTSITAVNLPNSIITIGDSAFSGCSSIANTIDISGATKLSTIGANAFANCTKLTGLSYPTTAPITSFGANAFSGCTSLTQLGTVANTFTAPAALTSIAASAFAGTKIATVDISNMTTATPFVAKSLAGMTSLSTVNFGSTITTLPANLFEGDTSLISITLPKSITSVFTTPSSAINSGDGYSAFAGSSLETVDMSNITSYVTTDSLGTTVPTYLFAGLATLKNVVLKTGTTAIGDYAFQNTSGLTLVKEASQNTASGYTTTDTLVSIGKNAFQGSSLPSFVVTALKTTEGSTTPTFVLGSDVFQGATSLTSVDLTNATNLVEIPTNAFNGTTALSTVKLPKPTSTANLTIKDGAFGGVTSLTSIDFTGFTSLNIEVNNFIGANSLKTINLSSLTQAPIFITNSTETKVFTDLPSGAIVQLSSAINTISNPAVFTLTKAQDASSYTRVALQYPNGLTLASSQINSGTLTNASSVLSNVTGALDLSANSTLTSLGTNTLFGNTNITSLTLPTSSITSNTNLYTLATGVTAQEPTNVNAKANDQYLTTNVPLGNNSALTNINFVRPNGTNISGPGALSQATFDAIAKIINSYAYYPGSSTVNTDTASVNFKKWDAAASNNNSSWIQADATFTYKPDATESTNGGTVTFTGVTVIDKTSSADNTTAATSLSLLSGTSKTYQLTHNGIKWNLVYNHEKNTLTLSTDSSTPANIYRGYVSSSLSVQVYLKTTNNDGNTIDTKGVQVGMSIDINPKSSSN